MIREFGNVKPSEPYSPLGVPKPPLEYRDEREPLVDIISDGVVEVTLNKLGTRKNR